MLSSIIAGQNETISELLAAKQVAERLRQEIAAQPISIKQPIIIKTGQL